MPLTPETLEMGRRLYRLRMESIAKQGHVSIEVARAIAQAAQKTNIPAVGKLPTIPTLPTKRD